MHARLRLLLLAALTGCSFDATGLGDSTGSTTTTTTATTTGAPTTTGPDPTTGEPTSTSTTTASSTGTTGPDATSESGSETTASETSPPPSCGDGILDPGEACDDGPNNGITRPCTPVCGINICGDGYPLDPDETCDDGNQLDTDACRNDCTLPPTCGNGTPDDGEMCDDGNQLDTDACIACKKASCGDGFVQVNVESCDDGLESAACNADCSLAKCGDTKLNVSAGEFCDLGAMKNGAYASGCAADCSDAGLFCGDAVVTAPDENCDPAAPPDHADCTADCKLLLCKAGFDDCDDEFTNGCEKDLQTDEDNCGGCGHVCLVLRCKTGSCQA